MASKTPENPIVETAPVPVVVPAIEAPVAAPVVAEAAPKAAAVKVVAPQKIARAKVAKVSVAKAKVAKPAKAPVLKPVIKISQSAPKKASAVKAAPAASSPAKKASFAKPTPVLKKLQAAEKVKTMFADINDRAKTAFEKTAKAGEEITEFTKGNMEAFAVSAKTAAKGAETIGQEIAEYSKKSFETASATMKSLAAVKTPTELFQIQSDYAKSAFDGAVSEASKLSEAWLKLAGDVFQPLSTRYALAAEKIKAAAL